MMKTETLLSAMDSDEILIFAEAFCDWKYCNDYDYDSAIDEWTPREWVCSRVESALRAIRNWDAKSPLNHAILENYHA